MSRLHQKKNFPKLWKAVATFVLAIAVSSGAQAQSRSLAAVDGDSWMVGSVSGDARIIGADGNAHAASAGAPMASGDRLAVGNGRAVLTRGASRVTLSENSDVAIGENGGDSLYTKLIQTIGTLVFQVEKQPLQRFEVQTPYLAATVKGTVFTVSLRASGGAVHVTEGAVQVSARDGGATALVRPGQTATVSSAPGAPVELRKRSSSDDTDGATQTNDVAGASDDAASNDGTTGTGNLTAAVGNEAADFAQQTAGFAGNAAPAAANAAAAATVFDETPGNAGNVAANNGNGNGLALGLNGLGNNGIGNGAANASTSSGAQHAGRNVALGNVMNAAAPTVVNTGGGLSLASGSGGGNANGNAGGNGNGLALGVGNGGGNNAGGNGNGLALGNGNNGGGLALGLILGNGNNGNAGGNGNGNAGGNGNGNANGNGNGKNK